MLDKPLATFSVVDRETNTPTALELWSPIAKRHKDQFVKQWRPIFDRQLDEIRAKGGNVDEVVQMRMIQDAHWQWASKADALEGRLDWVSFALDGQGVAQGLMFAQTAGFAKEASQKGKPLVKVVLLASAPWNRPTLAAVPRFKSIGRILLGAAISLSFHEEFAGRVGLHALPQAETWYRDVCGMTDLGVDGTGMRYFETTEDQAKAFLAI